MKTKDLVFQEVKPLHDMGFAILWLYPKSKRPVGDDWNKGPRNSWAILQKSYKQSQNIGVRLGEASKLHDGTFLCALDCDVKSSDPIHLREMELALMDFCPAHEFAPRVLSGRGGGSCHIYFRTREPQISFSAIKSAHKVKVYMPSTEAGRTEREQLSELEVEQGYRLRPAWEIDVFGEGKQVVLPPSTHPDTLKEYTWEYPLRDIEAIPLHVNFAPKKVQLLKREARPIAFEDCDLFSTPITEKQFQLITRGEGFDQYPSRSEAIFAALNSLVRAGLKDEQIFTVMTDPDFFISEKPLQVSKNDPERAARWLQPQIAKIRDDIAAHNDFANVAVVDDLDEILSEDEAQEQLDDLVDWVTRLEQTKGGQYKNTANNIYLILKNLNASEPASQCVFSYDEFNQSIVYAVKPPWGDWDDLHRELTDLDDIRIVTWLSREWGIETSEQRVASIAFQLAKENAFHPVQRYLKGLKWDGVKRLDTMLVKYCGAEGLDAYLADVGRKFMCAAVARVMQPGVKFDHVLILEGNQGVGKSTFVRTLAHPWYSDSLGDIANKDVVDNMRGRWLIEIGELSAMNRAETNELKAFITRQHDVTRKAYGRRSQSYPRQCVFVGTTNDDEYLKDATGGRRFWPVRTPKFALSELEKDRDQLWAEAFQVWSMGEKLFLDREASRLFAENEQHSRAVIDEIANEVENAAETCLEDKEFFTFSELWAQMQLVQIGGSLIPKTPDMLIQARIKKSLRLLGYEKNQRRVGGLEGEGIKRGRGRVWTWSRRAE